MLQRNINIQVEAFMSDTERSLAATAFQSYPAALVAAVLALFAPGGTAAATTLVLVLTIAAWMRSQRQTAAAASATGPFAGA